jgi:hypothetical protein
MRLLFASIQCYLDPSGGAAPCTRELLEAPAARGADCRALSTGVLDCEAEISLDAVLADSGLPARRPRQPWRANTQSTMQGPGSRLTAEESLWVVPNLLKN